MNMTQLREAFSTENVGWFQAVQIVRALRDPTPITESGLRELGDDVAETFDGEWSVYVRLGGIKTLGQLRLLLLSAEG